MRIAIESRSDLGGDVAEVEARLNEAGFTVSTQAPVTRRGGSLTPLSEIALHLLDAAGEGAVELVVAATAGALSGRWEKLRRRGIASVVIYGPDGHRLREVEIRKDPGG